ncbi:MAG TPA: hypothetical protein VGI39_37265 [Polyangiaceae bacterium]
MERESLDRGPEAWERFIDESLARFHASTSSEEKSQLLVRIGHVLRVEQGDEEQGFDAVLEALRLDPSNQEAVAVLASLARSLERWPQVIEAIRGYLLEEEDERRRVQLCEHAARWCKEEGAGLGNGAAEPFVMEIDRIDPSHWAVRRRMASIYREQGIWDLRREELERALLRAKSRAEVRDTRFALGELYEHRLDDLPRAMVHYEAALACAPQSRDVLGALVRVYDARELHDRQRDALAALISLVSDAQPRYGLLVQLAELWETRFLKPGQAAPLLEEALELVPNGAEALTRLERCYRAMRSWPEYARTLERQLALCPTNAGRASVLVRMGRILETTIRDQAKAIAAYRRACTLDPSHVEALTELARLSEKTDDWRAAADCRQKLAMQVDDPAECARQHVTIGALLEPANRDPERAREVYTRAASIDPRLAAAWEGLQRLAEQEGDYATAARHLTERLARAEGRRAKARLFGELGVLWERAGQIRDAIEAYEKGHATMPESAPLAHDLLRLYREARVAPKAAQLAVTLLHSSVLEGDASRALDVLRTAAVVARFALDPHVLLAHAARALARFPGSQEIAAAVIDVAHGLRDTSDAIPALHAALAALPPEAAYPAATRVKLGEIAQALGDVDRAVDCFVEALAVDEGCIPALNNLIEHFVASGDLQRAGSYRLWLARVTPDRGVRFAMLLDMANDLLDVDGDLEQAAWAFEEARAMDPGSRVLLDRLVSIYEGLEDWSRLLKAHRAIADSEELPALRASRVRSMAVIARTKLGDGLQAAELLEEALDLEPTRLDALEELSAICKEERDYDRLARAHARVLFRAAELGLRLGPRSSLSSAPGDERAPVSVRPARTEGSGVVSREAMERSARLESEARVRYLRARIAAAPLSVGAYRELGVELRSNNAVDAAWCVHSALQHFGAVDEEMERFVRGLAPTALPGTRRALTEADWYSSLLHPGLDRPLLAVLTLASSVARRAVREERGAPSSAAPLSSLGNGKGARLSALVRDAARALGVPAPLVHERNLGSAPLVAVPGSAPEVAASFATIDALPAGSIPFVVGRALADLHPVMAVRASCDSPAAMRDLYEHALRTVSRDFESTVDGFDGFLAAITDVERAELSAYLQMVEDRPEGPDFDALYRLLDLSALRAGMLLQGGVDRAWAVLVRECRSSGELPGTDLREELLMFAVSAEHVNLRERAGLAVRAAGGVEEKGRKRSVQR